MVDVIRVILIEQECYFIVIVVMMVVAVGQYAVTRVRFIPFNDVVIAVAIVIAVVIIRQ